MIGVYSKVHEAEIVTEFFELFKTPWEFYDPTHQYDVILAAGELPPETDAALILIYAAEKLPSDCYISEQIPSHTDSFVLWSDIQLPIYGKLIAFRNPKGHPVLFSKTGYILGYEKKTDPQRVLRIGYELFEEVYFLLTKGQPPEHALIPTLDLHISILRTLILQSGIPFVEIPPVPVGYNFITCLTHDIDFIRIRDHKFDHTMWGFLYRAIIGTLLNVTKGKNDWKDLFQNWKAVLTLPFVYFGLVKDFWFRFDRYMEIEKKFDARSTFFLIPFKNQAGEKVPDKTSQRRAAKYDITDIPEVVRKLTDHGFEVGVHGIDAWHDAVMAKQELLRIFEIAGQPEVGIRVHWLCFDENTPNILETAGFSYDSTFGYNDTAGYRAGSSQAFKPIGVKNLLELPLHIQDTAVFNPRQMSLSKKQAWILCKKIIETTSINGGVLTILWHDRSLSPERLYENFYIKLLTELKNNEVWFATATDACKWFNNRRAAKFENVIVDDSTICIKMRKDNKGAYPQMKLRVYHPKIKQKSFSQYQGSTNYIDIPWHGEHELSISVCDLQELTAR